MFDRRTRRDDVADPTTIDDALDRLVPQLLDQRIGRIDLSVTPRIRPLRIAVGERRWDATIADGRPQIRPTDDTETAITEWRLSPVDAADVVWDRRTPIGLMTGGRLDVDGDRIGLCLDWWLILRAVLDDEPMGIAQIALPDALDREFSLESDPLELQEFLGAAGFIRLRHVFTPEEMSAVNADIDAAVPHYKPDDGRSWWTTLGDGSRRLVRLQGFADHSPTLRRLLADDRMARLGDIAGAGHRRESMPGPIEALIKPIGVVEGISDVPWHKDCSLGRHSYECSSLTVGISVTSSGPTTGRLRVVAGSHRALIWPSLLDVGSLGLPDVPLDTEVGDVTIHLSCTLHMAEPPTESERRVLYTGYVLHTADETATAAGRAELRRAAREPASFNTSQAPAGGTQGRVLRPQ